MSTDRIEPGSNKARREPPKWWTTAEDRIVRACLPHCTYAEIGSYLGRSGKSVRGYCQRIGLSVPKGIGHKVGRRKGDPQNKLNCKPGSDPLPAGTERMTYRGVMVTDGRARWTRKAELVWRSAGRDIPKGMFIIHVDGDKMNFDLSNLALVTREELLKMNRATCDKSALYAKVAASRRRREAYKRAKAAYVDPFVK